MLYGKFDYNNQELIFYSDQCWAALEGQDAEAIHELLEREYNYNEINDKIDFIYSIDCVMKIKFHELINHFEIETFEDCPQLVLLCDACKRDHDPDLYYEDKDQLFCEHEYEDAFDLSYYEGAAKQAILDASDFKASYSKFQVLSQKKARDHETKAYESITMIIKGPENRLFRVITSWYDDMSVDCEYLTEEECAEIAEQDERKAAMQELLESLHAQRVAIVSPYPDENGRYRVIEVHDMSGKICEPYFAYYIPPTKGEIMGYFIVDGHSQQCPPPRV